MKIHGKTIKEIFNSLPVPYRVMVLSGCAFLIIIVMFISSTFIKYTSFINTPSEIEVSTPDEITNLIQPTIASDGENSVMAVSAQNGNIRSIRFLKNKRKCSMWSYVSNKGIEGKTDSIVSTDSINKLYDGMWSIETPTLIYDPDDAGKEWKLFAYKYFWPTGTDLNTAIETAKKYSVITYEYSSDINSGWSNEEWLFSPDTMHPPTPYSGLVKNHLNNLSYELNDVTSYARPSAIYKDGIILMALSAFTTQITPDRTILIASSDHGQSWIYVGSPFSKNDSKYFGDKLYKGATLIDHKKGIYLATTFGTETENTDTAIIKFKDAGKALLYRNESKEPEVTSEFELFAEDNATTSGGFPAYHKSCDNVGMIVSEKDALTGQYKLFMSNTDPSE